MQDLSYFFIFLNQIKSGSKPPLPKVQISTIGHFFQLALLFSETKNKVSGSRQSHTGHRSFCCHTLCPHCESGSTTASSCGDNLPGSFLPTKVTLSVATWPQHLVSSLREHHTATSHLRFYHLSGSGWKLDPDNHLSEPIASSPPQMFQ